MAAKRLYLVRHAKSSWDEPLADRERPLAARGRRAAPAMAGYMKREGLVPDRVLCSPATRTRQTWDLMAPILGADVPVSYHDEIYESGPAAVLDLVQRARDADATLMIVGHNPTLELLAEEMVGAGQSKLRDRLRRKYPTAALAVLELPGDTWQEATFGAATLTRFVRPKDLPEASARDL